MKKRVIILGQGRSGSTLMQRLLHCSIDDGFFCGENGGFWYFLYQSIYGDINNKDLPGFIRTEKTKREEYTKLDNFKPCWYNFYDTEALLSEYRLLFDRMYFSHKNRVIGFKEIRFPEKYDEIVNYINFFKKMFPDVFFIFTIRNLKDLSNSGWWPASIKNNPEVYSRLKQDQENLIKLSNSINNSILFDFDDFGKIEEIKKVFNFLGEYFNEEKIKMVLSNRFTD